MQQGFTPIVIVKIYHACPADEYYYLTITHVCDNRIGLAIVSNYRAYSYNQWSY